MEHNDDRLFDPIDQEPEVLLPVLEEPESWADAPEAEETQEISDALPEENRDEPVQESEPIPQPEPVQQSEPLISE